MGTLAPTLLQPADAGLLPSLDAWAEACASALQAGDRLLMLFGRADERGGSDAVLATAVTLSATRGLSAWRVRTARGASYPSLTARWPAAQMPERELWEQTGLQPEGHPWLKPVRFEGQRQQRMADYPFFSVRGQPVHEVGVGPIHASVIEPGHFRFMCHGERVLHLEVQLGYQHRGIEPLLLQRPSLALTPLIETVAGDSSVAYAWGHCAAIEQLAGLVIDPAAERVRGLALELERIAMHLVALTGLATDIAFLQGGATYGRLRTAVINLSQRLCGNRFGRGWLRPGGVRQGLDAARRDDLLATLDAFGRHIDEVNVLMRSARSVRQRLQGTGRVDLRTALDLGLLGLAARASGVPADARTQLPGTLYTEHPVTVQSEPDGDCWARLLLRQREVDESLRWLRGLLQRADPGLQPPPPQAPRPLAPDSLCVTVCEGFRGPVLQALETGADGRLCHYKVQDPSLFNWFGLAQSVRENGISDFPLCNKSFDLSYCGNDL